MLMRVRIAMVCGVGLAIFNGMNVEARALDPIAPEEMIARLQEFNYEPWNGTASEVDRTNENGCQQSKVKLEVRDPVTAVVHPVALTIFRPATSEKVPAVIVVPSMEGVTIVEPKIAAKLCGSGIAAVISDVVDTSLPKSLPAARHEDEQERRAILSLRTVLDVLSTHPAFDRDRLGIIGVSVGGIITSMMAGIEPDRLKAVVVVVGSGNLPYVLANSDNDKVSDLRRQRMTHLKIRENEIYEDWLRANLRYDPLYFAPRAQRDRIMMITARGDTTVPYRMQQDLFEAFGKPTVSEYSGSHVQTILSMTYFYFGDVIKFYKSRLGLSSLVPEPVTFH